ncbi:MAG: hypothetical protein AVDCRST_MAG05-1150 [uncultured Rubrobacteraceae bacterium]|uniref:Uncharacterized protein n=1 Tax=uncultured Rubrobacteraceae bacterium TaxID=349277 RepID=A0A6J4RWJ1_9ACTN|nr:MAG: hypothetical protein AVDCRST_MAG05-1150 [uncultured Rubrobacteraceae bacterium]
MARDIRPVAPHPHPRERQHESRRGLCRLGQHEPEFFEFRLHVHGLLLSWLAALPNSRVRSFGPDGSACVSARGR